MNIITIMFIYQEFFTMSKNIVKSTFLAVRNTESTANITSQQLISRFLSDRFSSKNTIATYSRYLTKYLDYLGVGFLSDFGLYDYANLRAKTTSFITRHKSNNTKRLVIAMLRSFWFFIQDVFSVGKNPVPNKINLPPRQDHSETKSTNLEGLRKLRKKLAGYSKFGYCDHLKYALVLLLSSTSLRISEALQVTVLQVREGRICTVQKRGKARELALPKETQEALLTFVSKYGLDGLLFQTSRKKTLSRSYAYRLIKHATGLTPHGFRKSVIECLRHAGYRDDEIAKVTGHSSTKMIDYYDNRKCEATIHVDLTKALFCP